jgi:hypothetical protein
MRRIRFFLAIGTAVAVSGTLVPDASARPKDRCPAPPRATVVLRTGKLVVLNRDSPPPAGEAGKLSTWTACWRATGRRTTLLKAEDIIDVGEASASFFRASGSYIAYLTTSRSHYGDRFDLLYLVSARAGRTHPVAQVGYVPPFSPLLGNQLLAVRLNERGFMGWKVLLSSGDSAIYARDSRGNRLLDSASGQFGPLGLVGNRLTWSLNGEPRFAVLR